MPFYIRKSISAGPFRFNFSNGGVGASVGVKGFRIGTGPRGHYVHAGRGGLYYRASLGKQSSKNYKLASTAPITKPDDNKLELVDDVRMVEVESGSTHEMQDESFDDLLTDLKNKQGQSRMSIILGLVFGVIALIAFLVNPGAGVVGLLLAACACAFGNWIDSFKRTTMLFYEMEKDREDAYSELTKAFDALSQCAGKWHVEAGGAVTNLTTWKRNAGASHIVKKKPTELVYKLPKILSCNITPPSIRVGCQTMYFMPDVLLFEDGSSFGAVKYSNLNLAWQDSNFIEDGVVPYDAIVIRQTWQHPNKSGGPDRRFTNNKQIPVCRYEVLHFSSNSGINELVEFSKTGLSEEFSRRISPLRHDTIVSGPELR